MKLKYFYAIAVLSGLFLNACDDAEFGEDYDIEFPISKIQDFTPKKVLVGENITLIGENLDLVKTMHLGAVGCEIQKKTPDSLIVKVSRNAERSLITIENNYTRSFTTKEFFTPLFYDAKVNIWPKEIERGTSFTLRGENMDLLKSVKIGNTVVSKQGTPTAHKIVYSIKDITLDEVAVISVEDKNGNKFVSDEIPVVAPKDTYVPVPTILLANFDNVIPEYVNENKHAHQAGIDKSDILSAIGHYWSTMSEKGNGWDGFYHRLVCKNALGGKIDFSSFTSPYLTFMVNTNGKRGYMNPLINGKDKHFFGNPNYTDNYAFSTKGWEWRSYDLKAMGFDLSESPETIEFLVRGGNIKGSEPFEINLDQMMITDGFLMPLICSDFEKNVESTTGAIEFIEGNAGQGNRYVKVQAQNVKKWGAEIATLTFKNMSVANYTNALYFNFLLKTTADAPSAYFQICFKQNGHEYVKHFKSPNPYIINYNMDCTNGEWKWRSFILDLTSFDWKSKGATDFDPTGNFDLILGFKPGNVAGNYSISIDYPIFTAVPIDNITE